MVQDYSDLQRETRKLLQLLNTTRQIRDEFVDSFTLLQQRFEQLELTATVFCENAEIKKGRSVSCCDSFNTLESKFIQPNTANYKKRKRKR